MKLMDSVSFVKIKNKISIFPLLGNEAAGGYCCDGANFKTKVLDHLQEEFSCCICDEILVEVSYSLLVESRKFREIVCLLIVCLFVGDSH